MRKSTCGEFKVDAILVHNGFYNYGNVVYIKNSVKVWITCPLHGDFQQSPCNHIAGKGCNECKRTTLSNLKSKGTEQFIIEATEKFGGAFNYKLVKYKDRTSKISVICNQHGKQITTPVDHLRSTYGCNVCAHEMKVKAITKSTEQFVNDAVNKHGDRYYYNLSEYSSAIDKLTIICSTHGAFEQSPNSHLSGAGCPLCVSSRGENDIRVLLNRYNINFTEQHKFDGCVYKRKLPFDFYLPVHNVCIEFDGKQHYHVEHHRGGIEGFELTRTRDQIKNDFCSVNNITLYRIRYDDDVSKKVRDIMEAIGHEIQPS